jgi:hypothetical protein
MSNQEDATLLVAQPFDPVYVYNQIQQFQHHDMESAAKSISRIEQRNLNSFILVIDFPNFGGGVQFFLQSILQRYKYNNTFIIMRNIDNMIICTVNDSNELFRKPEHAAISWLKSNKTHIKKIFVNHFVGHKPALIDTIFQLSIPITTITHDYYMIMNHDLHHHLLCKDIPQLYKCASPHLHKYHSIIIQHPANMNMIDHYVKPHQTIISTPLPDYTKSEKRITTSNEKIVVGIIGNITEIKGSKIMEKIAAYYKNNPTIHLIVFGSCPSIKSYPYKNINELNTLLCIHQPNVLIEASICVETYSYTLSLAMITQLPIVYLYKNGETTVEQRLQDYKHAYPFRTIRECNDLMYQKKQDHFYTIDPTIHYTPFWDQYFGN